MALAILTSKQLQMTNGLSKMYIDESSELEKTNEKDNGGDFYKITKRNHTERRLS